MPKVCVRLVPLFGRICLIDAQNAREITGRGADFVDPRSALVNNVQSPGDELRVVGEAGLLHGDKILEHAVHVRGGRRGAVGLDPALAYGRDFGDESDVDLLVSPHRLPSLFNRHGDPSFLEDLAEHDSRRHAAEVHRRPHPVEDDGTQRSVVGPAVSEFALKANCTYLILCPCLHSGRLVRHVDLVELL